MIYNDKYGDVFHSQSSFFMAVNISRDKSCDSCRIVLPLRQFERLAVQDILPKFSCSYDLDDLHKQ